MKPLSRALLAIFAAAPAGPCLAETTPYYIGGLVSYGYNSNVLGLADDQAVPPGYTSKSDNIASLALIAGIDQPIGRQRIFGDATLRNNRYARNDVLDNHSYAVSGGLDWETAERVDGRVFLRSSQDLIKYSVFDQVTPEKNLVKTNQADLSARIGVVTLFTFDVGAGYRSVDYSAPSYDARDYDQWSGSLGMGYRPSSDARLGVALRKTNGDYPHFGPVGSPTETDGFDRTDLDLTGFAQLTGASSVTARLSYSDISYEQQTYLDFDGFTGFVRGTWQATAKTRLGAEIARDRGQDLRFDDPGQVGIQNVESADLATILRATAAYELTAKIALNASAAFSDRGVFVVDSFSGAAQEGREKLTLLGLGATWLPTRTSRIGCDLSYERRRSSLAQAVLNTSTEAITCYAQLTLQP